MFVFLWDGKPDKKSRKTIIQDYENNGLKMIDIDINIKSIKGVFLNFKTPSFE